MDLYLDTLYRGYCGGVYTFRALVRSFSVAGVTAQECEQAGYDSGIVQALSPPPHSLRSLKKEHPLSFSVRPACFTDTEDLKRLEQGFLLELNGNCKKEDLSDVDALLLFQTSFPRAVGALWHEVLESDTDGFYVRALFTDPSIRCLGGGRVLLEHVLTVSAAEGGFTHVGLDAPENVLGFYRKMGFRSRVHGSRGMFSLQKEVEY